MDVEISSIGSNRESPFIEVIFCLINVDEDGVISRIRNRVVENTSSVVVIGFVSDANTSRGASEVE